MPALSRASQLLRAQQLGLSSRHPYHGRVRSRKRSRKEVHSEARAVGPAPNSLQQPLRGPAPQVGATPLSGSQGKPSPQQLAERKAPLRIPLEVNWKFSQEESGDHVCTETGHTSLEALGSLDRDHSGAPGTTEQLEQKLRAHATPFVPGRTCHSEVEEPSQQWRDRWLH